MKLTKNNNLAKIGSIFGIEIPQGTKYIKSMGTLDAPCYELERKDGLRIFIKLTDPFLLNKIRLTHPGPGFVIKAVGFIRGLQIILNYTHHYGRNVKGLNVPYPSDVNLNQALEQWSNNLMVSHSNYNNPVVQMPYLNYKKRYGKKDDKK